MLRHSGECRVRRVSPCGSASLVIGKTAMRTRVELDGMHAELTPEGGWEGSPWLIARITELMTVAPAPLLGYVPSPFLHDLGWAAGILRARLTVAPPPPDTRRAGIIY